MKNKKGKKLVVLGAMAALLTLIGVSGSQTYAKYIEEAKVTTQQATVAKWGIVMTADAADLFAPTFANPVSELVTVSAKTGSVVASATADQNILAPGCSGSLTFSIQGTTEVMTEIALNLTVKNEILLKGVDVANDYNPVRWTLKKGGTELLADATLKEIEDLTIDHDGNPSTPEIELFAKHTITPVYGVENTLTITGGTFSLAGDYELSYVWDYELDDATDKKDTYLGYLAAGKLTEIPAIYDTANSNLVTEFDFSLSATQVQSA